MKNLFFGALMLLVSAGMASCGSSKAAATKPSDMVEEIVPLSGPQYRSDAEYFRAVQNGVSSDRSMAQKIAMQNCRQELAANVESALKALIEQYATDKKIGDNAEVRAQYQELSHTVVNRQLSDIQVVDEKIYRQNDGSFRYYVCLQLSKAKLEQAAAEAIAHDAQLNFDFDREQFKKLFDEATAR